MSTDVSLPAALLAGLISFLSPCVLPLVPPYIVYLTGATIEHVASEESAPVQRRAVMLSALLFVLGFSTVFVALGASVSLLGQVMRFIQIRYVQMIAEFEKALGFGLPLPADPFAFAAGLVIIVMGLHFLGLTRIRFLMREGRLAMPRPVGLWGAYIMGLAFAFGWTPCIGPILAAILAVAASEATVAKGALLLAVYSAGLGIPFLIAAFAIEQIAPWLARMRSHLVTVERVMGALMVLTGIGFLTGAMSSAAIWLLETFPSLGTIG